MIEFQNDTFCQIKYGISSTDTTIYLREGDYHKLLGDGDYAYCALMSHEDKEIVKVDIAASSVTGGLSVARAQEGTTARAWPQGALFYQEVTETFLNVVRQHADYRTVTSDPDGSLSPNYANERIYRSDTVQWYQAVGLTTAWKVIAG